VSYSSKNELDIFSNKILEDYDSKNPSIIFKDKIKITNEEALIIQSNVARLRENRGEEIIGYKIGCVSKDTQKKMGFTQPACGYLWKSELYASGVRLIKKDYTNPAMEAEFGVMLNRDIKPELASFDYILKSIEGIYPLIEIHNLIFYCNDPY
jgi:2-keto-4-pentenoate hydratase